MGKYMKKSKITGDVPVMEVSHHSSCLGVRTRAKTLALRKLLTTEVPVNSDVSSCSYLELRNRRLKKQSCREQLQNPNPNSRGCSRVWVSSVDSSFVGSVEVSCLNGKLVGEVSETEGGCNEGIEASIGENNFEFEGRERSTRESTPCSLVGDTDIIGIPGSTTKQTFSTAANRRIQINSHIDIPTLEIEEFFSCIEQQQRRLFIEKYNFDIVNDTPLPGSYEWVQLFP